MHDKRSSKMTESNDLARENIAVRCPACGRETTISVSGTWECSSCGQALDAKEHQAENMAKRDAVLMREINASEKRSFLLALANSTDSAWVVKRFPKFFAPELPNDSAPLRWIQSHLRQDMDADAKRLAVLRQVEGLGNLLRTAWTTSDNDIRQWQTNYLRQFARWLTVHPSTDEDALRRMLQDGPPPRDTLQQALLYFQSRGRMARKCAANEECRQTRFFFAEKPNQKYCSDTCTEEARNAAKKLWWDQHGTEWRKASQSKKKGAKHGKR